MGRHRSRSKIKLSSPGTVLAASLCLVVVTVGLVLWFLNLGPRFPEISYVPDRGWADPGGEIAKGPPAVARPGVQDAPMSGAQDGLRTAGRPGLSGEAGVSTAQLSKEEKLAAIGQKYEFLLKNLKSCYEAELNRLIQHARNDYQAAGRGEKDISLSRLAVEYYRAGRALEKECDRRFDGLLENMKKELKMHGLPLDLAHQAEKEYIDQKNRARKEILVKIARHGG